MPTPDELRAFVRRDWDLVAEEKLRFRAERFREGGPAASRAVALRLRERWSGLHPGDPAPARREADLSDHIALNRKLDKTAGVVAGR